MQYSHAAVLLLSDKLQNVRFFKELYKDSGTQEEERTYVLYISIELYDIGSNAAEHYR